MKTFSAVSRCIDSCKPPWWGAPRSYRIGTSKTFLSGAKYKILQALGFVI